MGADIVELDKEGNPTGEGLDVVELAEEIKEPLVKLDNEPTLEIKLNRKQRRAFATAMRKRKKVLEKLGRTK